MKSILILVLLSVASIHCKPVYSGGPDPRTEIQVPSGGGCRLAVAYPINAEQARLKAEKGWEGLPFEAWRRIEIAKQVSAKKAEYLYVPDYLICGSPERGDYFLYGMDFWRKK